MKDFNVVIDEKSFFYVPVTDKEETYEKIIIFAIIIAKLQ